QGTIGGYPYDRCGGDGCGGFGITGELVRFAAAYYYGPHPLGRRPQCIVGHGLRNGADDDVGARNAPAAVEHLFEHGAPTERHQDLAGKPARSGPGLNDNSRRHGGCPTRRPSTPATRSTSALVIDGNI